MRNLINVIDEMLSVIPKNEISLIVFLEDVKESQRVRAPEDMTGWWEISKELDRMLYKYDKLPETLRKMLKPLLTPPDWQLKLCSIFTTKSLEKTLEEIEKNIYGFSG
jgi:hypothetical protein